MAWRRGRVESRWRAWREARTSGPRPRAATSSRVRARRRTEPLGVRLRRVLATERSGVRPTSAWTERRSLRGPIDAAPALRHRQLIPAGRRPLADIPKARDRRGHASGPPTSPTGVLPRVLRALPRPLASTVATVAGFTMSRCGADKRPLLSRNLRRVLGREVDEAVSDRFVSAAFDSYARYWVESARVATVRSDQIESTFSAEGFERFREEMARGRGVVIALPHVGSWEYGGRWLAQQGYPMTTVGELLEPPQLFEWFTSQRAALGPDRVAARPGHDDSAAGHAPIRDGRRTAGGPGPRRQRRRGRVLRREDDAAWWARRSSPCAQALRSSRARSTNGRTGTATPCYCRLSTPRAPVGCARTCSASPRIWHAPSRISSAVHRNSGTCSSRTGLPTANGVSDLGVQIRSAPHVRNCPRDRSESS